MKRLFFVVIIVFASFSVLAQKRTIAITSFEATSSNIKIKAIKAIEDKVKEAFYSNNRFNIVDRTNYDKLKDEKELQKTEDFMDGKTVSQSGLEGAEQIVTGSVNQVDIYKVVSEDGSYHYNCNISFSLQIIDVATGKLIATQIIKPKQSFGGSILSKSIGGSSTSEKAFYNSLKGTQKAIDKFIAKNFPFITLIIEISEASSNKAKVLLINTGTLNGAKKNHEFNVVEVVILKVGDKEITRKKDLGKIKITKVEGEEISVAKVVKGGEAIFAKFNAGARIECLSKN